MCRALHGALSIRDTGDSKAFLGLATLCTLVLPFLFIHHFPHPVLLLACFMGLPGVKHAVLSRINV